MQSLVDDEPRKMTPPQIAAVTAAGGCLLAFAIKLWLGRNTGSAAVSAAAWHAVAGLLYALLMLGILHTSDEQPADEDDISEAEREYMSYQSGLQVNIKRHEAMLALFGSIGLLAVAYLIFSRVLTAKPTSPGHVTVGLFVLAAVFFGVQFLGRFTERIGVEHETPGLVATSFHARTDAFATILAALALVTVAMGYAIERYFAALIGLLLVADAAQLFVDATRRIVGLEEDSPTAQLPFWVRLRDALRIYAEQMPPIVRWLLRYDDAMTADELRQARRIGGAVVLAVYLLTGFKTVQLGELGGLKVFGVYRGLVLSGPVYALWPFASVRIVPVDRVQSVTVGFTSAATWAAHQEDRAFGEMLWSNDNVTNQLFKVNQQESKFLLGDTTQVETHVVLSYTVRHESIKRYLFGIEKPEDLAQRAAKEATQQLMLTRTLDSVLVEDRAALEDQAKQSAQATLDALDAGMQVERVMIRSVHPPAEVLESFVDVASALEDKLRDVREAQGYLDRAQKTAEGEAIRLANEASGEQARRVSDARGQTSAYRQVQAAAQWDPAALKDRLAIETMERILMGKKKVIVPRSAGRGRTSLWFNSARQAAPPPTGGMGGPPAAPSPEPGEPKAPEGKGAEGKAPEGKGAEGKAPEGKAPAGKSGQ